MKAIRISQMRVILDVGLMKLEPLDPQTSIGVDAADMPRHIAIIMDGNGRWARQRGWPRIRGHAEGAKVVNRIVTQCARLGVEALTLYSFSHENWKRPREEVNFLMELYGEYLVRERSTIVDNNVQLVHLGRRDGLPDSVLREMDKTIELSKSNGGLKLCLALNYGGRTELIDAVRSIAVDAKLGRIEPTDIDENLISDRLYTSGVADPDLLIRTAGERRISNFLLWQISYAEIHICERCWPAFSIDDLHAAIRDYAGRIRRFGEVKA